MKLKFYLRTMLAALSVMAVSAGCNDKDDIQNPPPEEYSFGIAVSDISASSALLAVTPDGKSGAATYYCSVVEKTVLDGFASEAAYIEDDVAYLKAEAAAEGKTLSAYLASETETGTKTIPFVGLDASTQYYAYVYGITTEGVVTSPLAKQDFTTLAAAPEPGELTFEISVANITRTAADVNVIPSNNDDTYYFDVQMVAAFDGMSQEEILAEIIDGLTADVLSQGPDGLSAALFDQFAPLKPGTEYYVYAVGFDPGKGVTSALKMVTFTTEAATGTAPELTLSAAAGNAAGSSTATNITCTAYAPEAVAGIYGCFPKSVVDDMVAKGASLDEIVSANGEELDAAEIAKLTVAPGLSFTYIKLTPKTAYSMIYKVTGAGGMSTVKRADVTTTESTVQPSDMTFSVSVTDITTSSASIVVTPSNNTDSYFFDVQKKSVVDSFEGDLAQLVAAFDSAYAEEGGIAGMLSTGVETYNPKKLTAGTDYCVVMFGYSDGVTTTALSTYDFKTESAATSNLTFAIAVDSSAEPIPGGVNATITPSNNEEFYLFAFTLADEIDSMADDAEIVTYYEELYGSYISWLTTQGVYQTMASDFGGELACLPGADYYIVAFGYDGGATTAVSKTRFTAGAGPAAAGTTFTFAVSDIADAAATVTVTASKEPVPYMWDVISQADYNDLGGNAAGIAKYIEDDFKYYSEAFTPSQVIAGLGAWYSGAYYEYTTLSPSTVYIPYAACVDVSGKVIDTPVIGDSFTTLAATGASVAGKSYGRYGVNGDLAPKIYRPMETKTATPRMIETLLGRQARTGSVAPQASVRGAELAVPAAGAAGRVVIEKAAGMVAPEFTAPVYVSLRKTGAVQMPRKSAVRTPRR